MNTAPIEVFDTFRVGFQSADPAERTKGRSREAFVNLGFGELSTQRMRC